jgi:hypothetical protein
MHYYKNFKFSASELGIVVHACNLRLRQEDGEFDRKFNHEFEFCAGDGTQGLMCAIAEMLKFQVVYCFTIHRVVEVVIMCSLVFVHGEKKNKLM